MFKSTSAFLPSFVGLVVSLVGGAALAAPTITVAKVSNTSTRMTIKVTGSGFTKNKGVGLEVDSNFAGSGNDMQFASTTADGAGKINTTFTMDLNASCAIGVVATDSTTGAESGGKNLTYTSLCLPPQLDVHLLTGTPTAIEWTASHFTPGGDAGVWLNDLTNGQSVYTDFSVGITSGKYITHYNFAVCNHKIQLVGYDNVTDTPAPLSPTITTCH